MAWLPRPPTTPPPEPPHRDATLVFGTDTEKEFLKHLLWVKYLIATGRLDKGRQDR